MALFEKRYTNKVLLDDTEKLSSVIENARTIDGHTVRRTPNAYILTFVRYKVNHTQIGLSLQSTIIQLSDGHRCLLRGHSRSLFCCCQNETFADEVVAVFRLSY